MVRTLRLDKRLSGVDLFGPSHGPQLPDQLGDLKRGTNRRHPSSGVQGLTLLPLGGTRPAARSHRHGQCEYEPRRPFHHTNAPYLPDIVTLPTQISCGPALKRFGRPARISNTRG